MFCFGFLSESIIKEVKTTAETQKREIVAYFAFRSLFKVKIYIYIYIYIY